MTVLWSANLNGLNFAEFASTTVAGTGATLAANAAAAYASAGGQDALVTGGTGDSAYATSPAQTTTTSKLSAQFRFRIQQVSVAAGSRLYVMQITNNPVTVAWSLWNTGGTWQARFTNRNGGTTSVNLTKQTWTIGQWYLVEMLADWSGVNPVYSIYIDGTLDTTYTDVTAGTNIVWSQLNIAGLFVEIQATGGTCEAYYDEFKVADALIGSGAAAMAFRRSLSEFGSGAGRRQAVGAG